MRIFANLILVLVGGIYSQVVSEDLLELHCLNEKDCLQFTNHGTQSQCINLNCHCSSTETNETVTCRPKSAKLSNIIGGACPCTQSNTECNERNDVCFCTKEFMPSVDRRRCIKTSVPLGESCELSTQCWHQDNNYADCNVNTRICSCREGFIQHAQLCLSIVGSNKTPCVNDLDCDQYGVSAACANKTCVCSEGFISVADKSQCVSVSQYNETCAEDTQCQGSLGGGGQCVNATCTCSGNYFPYETDLPSGETKTVCARTVEIGQYCRDSSDCYQHQFGPDAQTMDCFVNECNCRYGYYSMNEAQCVKGSGAVTLPVNTDSLFVIIFIHCITLLF